ncbi:hypothetical protein [Patulibacter defluvii]|uniref:hypothetical protein n=1 Tax=Patulibacter defluvii TaxID=3095358 RepID=UPI002A753BFD|nr:hypothetical protein [Patulibacter sp. DM4]
MTTTTLLSTVGATSPEVVARFGPHHPNASWVEAHGAGRIPGRTWSIGPVDGEPSSWLVEVGAKFCYLTGQIDAGVLAEVGRLLERRDGVTVILPPDATVGEGEAPPGFRAMVRRQYRGRSAALARDLTEEGVRERIAAVRALGFEVRAIRPEDLEQPLLGDTMLAVYGSAEAFAAGPDLGFCAVEGDRIITWMHPVVGTHSAELGHATVPEHRRRGVPTNLVYIAARQLAEAGFDVTGSSDVELVASQRVAERIGMTREHDYPALVRDDH